jgi:hypothetical protein
MKQTLAVPHLKPRNPLVAASLRRRAGAHRRSNGGQRQRHRRALAAELRDFSP